MTETRRKGWCPGLHRPMESGDGLIVRVRPHLGRLRADQVLGLCAAAQAHGSGVIDLTTRANLQIRGVRDATYPDLVDDLTTLDLVDADADREARRNIVVNPDWTADDDTHAIAQELTARLDELPALPGKFGFAVDAGPAPMMTGVSADIRVERDPHSGLIVRADGAAMGRSVSKGNAVEAVITLAHWFAETGGSTARRMSRHLQTRRLPDAWTMVSPAMHRQRPTPGSSSQGHIYGAAFGSLDASALAALVQASRAAALRVTPWRLFVLEDSTVVNAPAFITDPDSALLNVDACPGAPYCHAASVETRAIARKLAMRGETLHVSGCEKGCARPREAEITLVGRDGLFDIVRNGAPWDTPSKTAISADHIAAHIGAA